jgi:Ca-activated chloride channel homolog
MRGISNIAVGSGWLQMCIAIVLSLIVSVPSLAQTNRLIQEGNDLYQKNKLNEAANDYFKAIQKDTTNAPGYFNLGNTLYRQNRFDSSRQFLKTTERLTKDKVGKAAADYNIGNTYMAQKKWEDAVSAYKQTLRNNPNDMDAKYNLAYAQEMAKKQQQDNKNQQKDQQNKDKNNQDKKNDKKDDKKNDKKDDKKDDKQDKQDKQDQQNKQEQKPSTLSKEDAENMLNALQNQEKKLHDKLNKEKGANTRFAKDW